MMKRTAKDLAEAVGARLEGDGAVELAGVAAPERAGTRDLIYVESAKQAKRAVVSAALCVIAAEGITLPGKTVLRSALPKMAFARSAELLLGRPRFAWGINPPAMSPPLGASSQGVGPGRYAGFVEIRLSAAGPNCVPHPSSGSACWIV